MQYICYVCFLIQFYTVVYQNINVNRFYINFIVCLTVSTTTLFLVNWGVGLTGMSNWEKNNWMHGDVILILITVHIYQRNGQIVCRGWGKERCVMNMGYLPFLFLPFVVVVWTDLLFAWIYICICKGKQVTCHAQGTGFSQLNCCCVKF